MLCWTDGWLPEAGGARTEEFGEDDRDGGGDGERGSGGVTNILFNSVLFYKLKSFPIFFRLFLLHFSFYLLKTDIPFFFISQIFILRNN